MDLHLHPRQGDALLSPATEILYGGAAGGGKSHLMRAASIIWSLEIPGLQTYLFRRTYPELVKNHIEGPSGYPVLLNELIERKYARINWSDLDISFGNRSKIFLCHCQYPKDMYKYLGAEMHVFMPDEATSFSADIYRFLRSRVRMAGITLPPKYVGRFPRILGSSNPGNVGHNWVKAAWVTPKPPMEVWRAPRSEGGMLRQFIPAKLSDNPSIQDPEEYKERLSGIGDPALAKAMEDGDWNIVAGGMFDDLWNAQTEDRIVVKPFEIPKTWRITRAMDWGSSKPFAVGWFAESDGTEATLADGTRRSWYRGTLFQIGEWYGWNGRDNEGCKLPPTEVAKAILQREEAMGIKGRVLPGPADSNIFDVDEGDSVAAKFARCGVRWESADKSPGSRKNGAEDMRERLTNMAQPFMEGPGLGFFNNCREGSIRTIPTLPRDKNKTDDVDSDAEDHAYDMVRYRCMWGGVKSGSGKSPI